MIEIKDAKRVAVERVVEKEESCNGRELWKKKGVVVEESCGNKKREIAIMTIIVITTLS